MVEYFAKVARPQVAADSRLLHGFESLAVSTLEDEIVQTRPHIVIFVTAHFSDAVIAQIAGTWADDDWVKSEDRSSSPDHADIWCSDRADGIIVVSMRHPMGAKSSHRAHAALLIKKLLAEKAMCS